MKVMAEGVMCKNRKSAERFRKKLDELNKRQIDKWENEALPLRAPYDKAVERIDSWYQAERAKLEAEAEGGEAKP